MSIAIQEIDAGKTIVVQQKASQPGALEILASARKLTNDSGYAGDVTPQQAWHLFSGGIVKLIDVRTHRELEHVGSVPGAEHIEWLRGEDMQLNPRFLSELKKKADKEDIILLLCRSGKRSVAAAQAATQAGFTHVFNVLEGFEGDGNSTRGWLNHKLPTNKN